MAEVRTPRTKLKEMREHMGLSQQQLADLAHMSRSRYAEIERGDNIQDDHVAAIVLAFKAQQREIVFELRERIKYIEQDIYGWQTLEFNGGLFHRDKE